MQVLIEQQPRPKSRPLRTCPVCKEPGYIYAQSHNGHRYTYTTHYNEPAIGTYSNGQPKYRQCRKGGRLYETIEEAEKAEQKKKRLNVKTIAKKKIIRKKTVTQKKHKVNCPKCGHRGRLHIANRKEGRYVVVHNIRPGKYWGKNSKVKQRDRCYIKKGIQTEIAQRVWRRIKK